MIIDIPAIESFFTNSSFVILFFTTVYYWFKISFGGKSAYTHTGLVGYGSALFCLTLHLIFRWLDSGHFPLSNLYESLIFLAWCLLILHIYIENSIKTLFLGVLTSPALFCLVAFTDFSLPAELQRSGPLVPALQSNWLVMHVTVMIASYAALLLGCLIAIAYLIFSYFFTNTKEAVLSLPKNPGFGDNEPFFDQTGFGPKNLVFGKLNDEINKTESFSFKQVFSPSDFALDNPFFVAKNTDFEESTKPRKFLDFLDNLSYRTIGIGFCFLTLGILSGAVWANETWGNYWSWDPKETWAFITWLTFASYLHSRLVGGWTGSKPAWIASFGFVIVWVCYLGVNLLGQGLHSYGFLQI
uniref:Cytochrome c biogenesis protein CcsA n=2 Tax=Chlorella TaxID=3071 RepID=F2YGK4_CHLVA|nr:cytochrome c biogenesis protein [Chlorella variabilis]ADZ05012.1 cytochrome c biogenesis protein [Chlorella variabilis]AIH00177.1 cytochrome c heme attachment protein [Chlorella variabilis]AJP09507.1 cytochrome c biogenesis protein CcsA [Chlorella variabilis]AST08780.1 cytochrome c heme attachment protein [Chlorella sp. ATCC 30562]